MNETGIAQAEAPILPADAPEVKRGSADAQALLADRVEQLYSQLPLGIVATAAIGLLTTFELWEKRLHELIMLWWATILVVSLACAVLYFAYRRSSKHAEAAAQWMRWLGISALANGAGWGFAGAVFFPSHADEQQIFLSFILTGLVSSGIAIYAGSWRVYAVYAAGAVLPFTYALATFGNRLLAEIALLVPFYYAINVAIAYRLNQVFDAAYRLRNDYGRLTQDHSRLNKRLETQLIELGEAKRQVEASGRKLALFAERAPICVLELDAGGNVLQLNRVAELLFGYARPELLGRPASLLVHPDQQQDFGRSWEQLVSTLDPVRGVRFRNLRRDGIELICEWTITPLVNTEGKLLAVIAQGQDITKQLEVERMKNEFTSTLSHELRTPLTSIIGSLQLINSGVMGEIDKDVAELTGIAERNGQRLLDLINDILDIEKIESGKLALFSEVFALGDLTREAMLLNRSFAERFGVSFQPTGDFSAALVRADRKRMLQVMTNLLSNAAKFSPQGSAVEVSMEEQDGKLTVGVSDHGPGIPPEFRSRIFSRFAQADSGMTRQQGGTGLGLAISKRLVELMGGRIGFKDRAGGGTTFWLALPRYAGEP